ncbi:hypothetical protein VH569_31785 [Azospirillum sp. 11R-A]
MHHSAAAGLIFVSLVLAGIVSFDALLSAKPDGRMRSSNNYAGPSERRGAPKGLRMICVGILLGLLSGCATNGAGGIFTRSPAMATARFAWRTAIIQKDATPPKCRRRKLELLSKNAESGLKPLFCLSPPRF